MRIKKNWAYQQCFYNYDIFKNASVVPSLKTTYFSKISYEIIAHKRRSCVVGYLLCNHKW